MENRIKCCTELPKVAYTRWIWQLCVVVVGGKDKWWIFWTWKLWWICKYKYHLGNYLLSWREWKITKSLQGWWRNSWKFFSDWCSSRDNTLRWRRLFYSSPKWGFWRKLLDKLFSLVFKSKHRGYILDVSPNRLCERWHVANNYKRLIVMKEFGTTLLALDNVIPHVGKTTERQGAAAVPQLQIQSLSVALTLVDTLIKLHHPRRLIFLAGCIN